MKLELAIREYLKEIEVRKYSPMMIRTYWNNLGLFLRFCEETGVTEVAGEFYELTMKLS